MDYGAIPMVSERVSRLIMGSLVFSLETPERRDITFALLDRYVEAGGNAVDTAYIYGRGASEQAIGVWLRERSCREQMIIITKGGFVYHPDGRLEVSPELISQHLAASLEHLQVETIDLYLLHRDDPAVPVGELVDCLNEHLRAGRIRAFGGSNWHHRRLEEANAYAQAHGLRSFVASSPNLALAVPREPMWADCLSIAGDREALAWYRQTQFPVLAWSAQARGFFSGRFSPESQPDPDVARVYYTPDNWERLRRAREIAARHACSPTQVALAWVLRQPLNVFPIVGPATAGELEDTLGALNVRLSEEETAWLNLER